MLLDVFRSGRWFLSRKYSLRTPEKPRMRGKANITEGFLCIRHLDRCLLCARAVLRLTLVFDLLEAGVVEAYPLAGKAATLTIDSDHPRVETGISKIYTRKGACCPAGTVNGCKFVRSADYAGQDGHIKFSLRMSSLWGTGACAAMWHSNHDR